MSEGQVSDSDFSFVQRKKYFQYSTIWIKISLTELHICLIDYPQSCEEYFKYFPHNSEGYILKDGRDLHFCEGQ